MADLEDCVLDLSIGVSDGCELVTTELPYGDDINKKERMWTHNMLVYMAR